MSSAVTEETRFILTDDQARKLAAEHGTPLYVIDEAHLRNRIKRYVSAFRAAAPKSEVTYASKANTTLAVIRIAFEEGCLIDVASEGELRGALRAGVPANKCHLHGNNKSRQELEFAFEVGINQIVVDNFAEIETIAELAKEKSCPDLVIRLAPGVDPTTHAKISTGQADTKFGFNISDGSGEKALSRALELGLPVVGFHCHVGSQLLDPEAQINGGQILAGFAAEMKRKLQFETKVLNVGGGMGVRYTEDEVPMPVEQYCKTLVKGIREAMEGTDLDPLLVQEPGRWIVSESGVTLYRIGVVKTVPSPSKGERTFVAVDGGLADNPRPALYGSPYPVRHVPAESSASVGDEGTFTISGRHCETDKLFEDIRLPDTLKEGDLLQILCTGGYNQSMASNYNRYQRPATALLRPDGSSVLVQRPETWDEMFERELLPEGV
ncbi:MAG: diaminopimelate decarboxylase [Fimbriimonadaceae bacterium]